MISRITVFVLVAFGAHAAHAGVLATGPLYIGDAQNSVICQGVNIGTKPVKRMQVSVVDVGGNLVGASTCTDLEPGAVCGASATTDGYCRIDFTGSKSSVRGNGSVNSLTGNNVVVVEPAR